MQNSRLGGTITIGDCETGVADRVVEDGCLLSKHLEDCADDARNHGQKVSCITHLAKDWLRAGRITGREHGHITACAARESDRKHRAGIGGERDDSGRSRP